MSTTEPIPAQSASSPTPVQSGDTPLLVKFPPLFGNRNFLLLWAGYVVSALGDRIHFLVMLELLCVVILRRKEYGTQQSSQLTIAMLTPFLFLGPITGIIADRFSRRGIMIVSDLARVAIVMVVRTVFLNVFDMRGIAAPDLHAMHVALTLLFASEFIIAMFAALFSPARLALLPNLVHPDQLLRANSLTAAAGTIASLIGFIIGSWLVSHDLKIAMYVDAATFLASATCIVLMNPTGKAGRATRTKASAGNFFKDFTDAVRYMLEHRRVFQIIILMLLFWGCGTVILNGLTGIITNPLYFNLPNNWVGYFLGIVGIGMIVGAASASLAQKGIPKEIGIGWAMVLTGVFLLAFSVVRTWWLGLILLCIGAGFGAVLLVTLDTLLQRIVPNFVRGRVMGVKDVVSTFGLISAAIPLAIYSNIDSSIKLILMVMSTVVCIVGICLVILYYRNQYLPLPVSIIVRFASGYLTIWKRFKTGNANRIPTSGPVIFVSNHSTAYDPVALQIASKRRLIQFMMAKEYYLMKPFHYLYRGLGVIPVNRTGNDTASIRAALRVLHDGGCIGMFPEGKISIDGRMDKGRPGVALLALMSGATVVPAYIQGTNVHAGMIADFLKPGRITLYFGRPIRFNDLKGRHRDEEAREIATKRIMEGIVTLRDRYETDPERRKFTYDVTDTVRI